MSKMKIRLKGEAETRRVWIKAGKMQQFAELKPHRSQRVCNHSPDGFNWAYAGSGPAQLALAIMLVLTGNPGNYQGFKFDYIANLPKGDFEEEFTVDLVDYLPDEIKNDPMTKVYNV